MAVGLWPAMVEQAPKDGRSGKNMLKWAGAVRKGAR
jgi:hypothetical protein